MSSMLQTVGAAGEKKKKETSYVFTEMHECFTQSLQRVHLGDGLLDFDKVGNFGFSAKEGED